MKSQHLVMLGMIITAITAITLGAAWGRDKSRAERALVTDVGPAFTTPVTLTKTYRVNCDSAVAANVLVPMDGGSSAYPQVASTILVSPCVFDDDGGPGTCDTQNDIIVGSSDVDVSTGLRVGRSDWADARAYSADAKGAWCLGYGSDQQANVTVGRQ